MEIFISQKPITEIDDKYKYNSDKIIFLSKNIIDLNPTPMVVYELPNSQELNNEFEKISHNLPKRNLYIYKNQDPNKDNILFSSQNAYVPDNKILEFDNNAVTILNNVIIEQITNLLKMYFHNNEWRIEISNSWIQKYKDGSFLSPHNHMIVENQEPNLKYFSLAYYIDDGNPDDIHTFNGCVTFQVNQKVFHIRPKPGLLLIWESHLIHNVNPFFSKDKSERMMISANIICIPQQ
jgi:hypothetical protein